MKYLILILLFSTNLFANSITRNDIQREMRNWTRSENCQEFSGLPKCSFLFIGCSESMYDSSAFTGALQDSTLNAMSSQCKQKLLNEYADRKSKKLARTCTDDSCKREQNEIKDTISYLVSKTYSKTDISLACTYNDNPTPDFIGLVENLKNPNIYKALKCGELKTGQHHVVSSNYGSSSPTGIAQKYTLEKTGDKNYNVYFDLKFKQIHPDTSTPEEMHSRVRSCIRTMNKGLKGPNGEMLNFVILSETNKQHMNPDLLPPTETIEIARSTARSHSRSYADNLDCSVILHEVLHLTGLCDEYKENSNIYKVIDESTNMPVTDKSPDELKALAKQEGFKPIYRFSSCRAHSEGPSIMSHQREVVNSMFDKRLTCECTNESCEKINSYQSPDVLKTFHASPVNGLTFKSNAQCRTYVRPNTPDQEMTLNDIKEKGFQHFVRVTKDEKYSLRITYPYAFATDEIRNDKTFQANLNCTCLTNDETCIKELQMVKSNLVDSGAKLPRSFCPHGSTQADQQYSSSEDQPIKFNEKTFQFTSFSPSEKVDSLLKPVHFAKILAGDCTEKTTQYNRCMQYAYKDECPERPVECSDPSFWENTK